MGSKTNNGSPQTTPKRTMSPLRRFNKVAPSPVKPPPNPAAAAMPSTTTTTTTPVLPLVAAVAQPSSLQSNSASVLDEKRSLEEKVASEKERPGSAPLDKIVREGEEEEEEGEHKHNVAKPISLEPVIVVRSKNGDLVVQEWENQDKKGTLS